MKGTVENEKNKAQTEEYKGPVSEYLKKFQKSIRRKQPHKKWAKYLTRYFMKEGNKHMKGALPH